MEATFFIQTRSPDQRGNTVHGKELLRRMHIAGHRIEIHTGSADADHEPHAERGFQPDNMTEIAPYDVDGDNIADGENRLESDLIQAKLFVDNLPEDIPTQQWVRPPNGWTWHGSDPEPIPNKVKDTYVRANLYLGPIHSNGYPHGKNWTIDSGDSVPLTPAGVIQQLQTQIELKIGAPNNHKKLVILFHDMNPFTVAGSNLNDYIVAIDEKLRSLNKAPSYVTLPDPPFPEAIQD